MTPISSSRLYHPGRLCLSGLVPALMLWAFCLPANAQSYSCQVNGRTLTSDRPIPECAAQPMRELRKTGVVRVIPAPLTPEQQLQKQEEQRKQKLIEDAAREKLRQDRALLASYSNVDQIEAARQRALLDAKEVIAGTNERIALIEKDRKVNAQDAQKYKDQALPAELKRRIDSADLTLLQEQKGLASNEANMARINQKYDTEKNRFLELTKPAGKN